MDTELGMKKKDMNQTAEALSSVLADSYFLYLKSHNYHWNVTGPRFAQLHELFEEQYQELAEAVDDIAERIRALDKKAPGTFREFSKLTSIEEKSGDMDAAQMIDDLRTGHEAIARKAREAAEIAESARDEASADLLTERIKTHEKTAWMLRSLLE